jgi:hypothetical protein
MPHRHQTRSAEYMLSCIMIAWSLVLLIPGITLHGTQFVSLLQLMPSKLWGIFGLIIGSFRVFALVMNGSWTQSPWLRFIGASIGFQFWMVVSMLNVISIEHGAFIYPIFGCFPVFTFFEAYACFKCGQDIRIPYNTSVRLMDSPGHG